MPESMPARMALLFACALLFVVCDGLAANWGKTGSQRSLVAVVALAPFSYILFGYVNKKMALAVSSAWVTLFLCISTVLIGFFYFGETLTGRQIAGLILAILAIVLLIF
jgi:multidrug transporter EmrE-like cation transporter